MSVSRTIARALVAASLVATLIPAANAPAQSAAYRIAPSVNPEAPAVAPLRGVFRVQLQQGENMSVSATIIVERIAGQLSAIMMVDQQITPVQAVRVDGDVLEGVVSTEAGKAKLSVRITNDAVEGTLTAKKRAWTVRGERSA